VARVPAPWSARVDVFIRYEADVDNVRAALGWCLEQGDIEAGLRLCTSVRPCWIVLGAFAEGGEWYDAFLSADQSGVPASVRGPAMVGRAQLALGADEQRGAEPLALAGLELCRAAGDIHFIATALNLLAECALHTGRPQEALDRAAEAVEHARQTGDKWNQGYALGSQATALAFLGRLAEARTSAEHALALMMEIDQQWGAARTRLGLANLERLLGDLDAARRHFLAALVLLRKVKGDPEIARCLAGLGRVALEQGNLAEARTYLARSLRLSLDTGNRTGISRGLLAFATLAVREGQPGRAVRLAAAVTGLSAVTALPARSAEASQRPLREAAHLPPLPARRVQRYLDAAAHLGEAEVARLWDSGLDLTASEATELALLPPEPADDPAPAAPPPPRTLRTSAPAPRRDPAGQPHLPPPAVPAPRTPEPDGSAASGTGASTASAASRGATLTAREREVVALIALGKSNKAIAETLFISPATAARHVANILAKLGYSSRSQVAAWSAAQGTPAPG
jgi:ATP/maltotriose-dependent transcriptional regulator MalT